MRKTQTSGEYIAICTDAAIISFDVQSDSTLHVFDASQATATSQNVSDVLSTSKPTPGQPNNYNSDAAINLFCPPSIPAADEDGFGVTAIALAATGGFVVLVGAIAYFKHLSSSSLVASSFKGESPKSASFIF